MISPPAGCREELQNSRSEIDDDGRDGTLRGIWAIVLGFSRLGEYMGVGTASMAKGGHHAIARRGPTLGRTLLWCGALGCPQVPSGLRDLLDLLFMAELISSDSEHISLVGFLKRKTAENTELALWHLVNRLVPENA